ncbi:unnamed protein product [Camellia sinensis]
MTLGTYGLDSNYVNQMGGRNVEKAKVIQTLLFVSRFNTLLQSLFGIWLPSVISGSYFFIVIVLFVSFLFFLWGSNASILDYEPTKITIL